jgi:DNA-binding transcriptional ArsR family regulator
VRLQQTIAPSSRPAAYLFRLLSDDLRLGVVMLLAQGGEMTVGELTEALGRSQPAVSNGLHQLRLAQLVDFRCRGKTHAYRLTSPLAQELLAVTDRHLGRGPGEGLGPLEEPHVPDPVDGAMGPGASTAPGGARAGGRGHPGTPRGLSSPAPHPRDDAPSVSNELFPTRIRLALEG